MGRSSRFGLFLLLGSLASGCVTNRPDGASCATDRECSSQRCQGGACTGSDCACGAHLCNRDQVSESADCGEGWLCYGPAKGLFDPVSDFFSPYQPQHGRCYQGCGDKAVPVADAGAPLVCPASWGCSVGKCVYPAPPTVKSDGPYTGTVGVAIAMHATATTPAGVDRIVWAFNDGTPDGLGADISHTYQQPGSYPIYLSLFDKNGAYTNETTSATVCPPAGADAGTCP